MSTKVDTLSMLLGTCHQDLPDNVIDCLAIHAKEQGYINFSVGAFFADLRLSDRMFTKKERPAPELETFFG